MYVIEAGVYIKYNFGKKYSSWEIPYEPWMWLAGTLDFPGHIWQFISFVCAVEIQSSHVNKIKKDKIKFFKGLKGQNFHFKGQQKFHF